MKPRQLAPLAGAVAVLIVAAGCTLGPDPERPLTAAEVSESFAHASRAET